MRAVLKVATNERENDYVSILGRKFQAHVEMVFEELVVKAI